MSSSPQLFELPIPIIHGIFEFNDIFSMLNCVCVCTEWNQTYSFWNYNNNNDELATGDDNDNKDDNSEQISLDNENKDCEMKNAPTPRSGNYNNSQNRDNSINVRIFYCQLMMNQLCNIDLHDASFGELKKQYRFMFSNPIKDYLEPLFNKIDSILWDILATHDSKIKQINNINKNKNKNDDDENENNLQCQKMKIDNQIKGNIDGLPMSNLRKVLKLFLLFDYCCKRKNIELIVKILQVMINKNCPLMFRWMFHRIDNTSKDCKLTFGNIVDICVIFKHRQRHKNFQNKQMFQTIMNIVRCVGRKCKKAHDSQVFSHLISPDMIEKFCIKPV